MVEKTTAGWLGKFTGIYKGASGKHRAEIATIRDELGVFPEQLAPLFIEPDLQIYNPARDGAKADPLPPIPAFTDFQEWLNDKTMKDDGSRQLFILAHGGMGKSALLAMLKLGQLNKFWPSKFACVVMKLGPDTLDRIGRVEERGRTILLLDGLDGDRAAFGRVKSRIVALLEATRGYYRVVITCRTPFFPKTGDSSFWHRGQVKTDGFTCPVKHISDFSDAQARTFLKKKFKRRKAQLARAEKLIKKMDDLGLCPMLLAYVDDLMEAKDTDDLNAIYTTLVEAWLDREIHEPDASLEKKDLLKVCHLFARHMMKEGGRTVLKETFREFLQDHPEVARLQLADVGGRSLLHKNSDGAFRFAQQSFQEFLTVQTMKTMGWHGRVTEMMAKFMRGLCLSETNLSGSDMTDANLNGANLSRANLSGVSLGGANLSRADLSGTYLYEASLLGAVLVETGLVGADLVRANLGGVDLNGANLNEVDLSGANLSKANLVGADLLEANLTGTLLCRADLAGANLSEVDLSGADLSGANLAGLQNWQEVSSWDEANIYNIRHAPEGFRQWVIEDGGIEEPPED